jgi:hypothetical protein
LLDGSRLETYLLPHLVHPGLLQPPCGSPSHGCRPGHDLLMLVAVLLFLLGCWKLAPSGVLSSGNAMLSGLVPQSGNILGLLLALGLLSCSNWLLWQEGEVLGCSASDIGFPIVGCVAVMLLLRELPLDCC